MAEHGNETQSEESVVDHAVAEGGAYDIIRKRLIDQGADLKEKVKAINGARIEEFGSSAMEVSARVRVRTENNCIARDIVHVGEHLLFGYNAIIRFYTSQGLSTILKSFIATINTRAWLN